MPADCPICGAPVPPEEPARPFCSRRCKMVDLGRWFTESYRVPGEPSEDAVGLEDLPSEDSPTGPSPAEEPPGRDG